MKVFKQREAIVVFSPHASLKSNQPCNSSKVNRTKSVRENQENAILSILHHNFIFSNFCCTCLLRLKKSNKTRLLTKFLNGRFSRSKVTCNKNILFRFMVKTRSSKLVLFAHMRMIEEYSLTKEINEKKKIEQR